MCISKAGQDILATTWQNVLSVLVGLEIKEEEVVGV